MLGERKEVQSSKTGRKNTGVAVVLLGVVAGMVGLSFASVPLYRIFCQVTGYGGTTQVADVVPGAVSERLVTVRFNADINKRLPWSFKADQREVVVRIGEPGLAFFTARNETDHRTVGTAVFNVTPEKVGQYFNKVACFCFDEQALNPGEEVQMGVSFFVDPAILEDRGLDDVKTITLSYTFFRDLDDWDAEQSDEANQAAAQFRAGQAADTSG